MRHPERDFEVSGRGLPGAVLFGLPGEPVDEQAGEDLLLRPPEQDQAGRRAMDPGFEPFLAQVEQPRAFLVGVPNRQGVLVPAFAQEELRNFMEQRALLERVQLAALLRFDRGFEPEDIAKEIAETAFTESRDTTGGNRLAALDGIEARIGVFALAAHQTIEDGKVLGGPAAGKLVSRAEKGPIGLEPGDR